MQETGEGAEKWNCCIRFCTSCRWNGMIVTKCG